MPNAARPITIAACSEPPLTRARKKQNENRKGERISRALPSRAVGSDLSLFSSSIRHISGCDHPADDVTLLLYRVCRQFVPGTFVDQQIDQRQPPPLVDRLGQQFSITRIVEFRIRLIHWRAPALGFLERSV